MEHIKHPIQRVLSDLLQHEQRPLTTDELCDFLRASRSTIDQYNREGMPRFYVGKECRFIPSKVIAWLERRCHHKVSPTEETFDPRREMDR